MRVHRKQVRKRLVFVLLLSLLVAVIQPVSGFASEQNNSDVPEKEPTTISGSKDDSQGGSEDDAQSDAQGDSQDVPADQEESSAPMKDNTGDSDSTAENEGQSNAKSSKFEANGPVIEKVDFKQNGTTVKNDSLLTLSLCIYDESAISDVRVSIRSEESGRTQLMELSKEKGTDENEYIFTYQLDGIVTGKLAINSIVVVDEHSNRTDYDVYDPSKGDYRYWVNAEASENDTIRVKNFSFPKNGQSAESVDEIMDSIVVEMEKAIKESTVHVRFENEKENGSYYSIMLSTENYSSGSLFNQNNGASSYITSGKYVLKKIYVERGKFGMEIPLELENKESYSFTLTKDPDSYVSEPKVELASVALDKNGQRVKQGDKVEITVGVTNKSGEDLPKSGYMYFRAAAPNVDDSYKYAELILGEDQKYHGTLSIENMYPCEWYVDDIYISGSVWSEYSFSDKERYPYYVYVYNGEGFVNPSFDVTVDFYALNANGDYCSVSQVEKKNVERRQTMKELGIQMPEVKSDYPGLTQIGWMDSEENDVTEEDIRFFDNSYIQLYAKYDKGVITASYKYPGASGDWRYRSLLLSFDRGTTYGEILKRVQGDVPEDITKEYSFSRWECEDSDFKESDVITDSNRYISFVAKFADVTLVQIHRHCYDQDGNYDNVSETLAVKEGTTVNDIKKKLSETEQPKSYEGLRFQKWDVGEYLTGSDAAKDGQDYWMNAVYENCLVRYVIRGSEKGIYCQLAEKGETVTAMTTFDGLDEIIWDSDQESAPPSEPFVVNGDKSFYGSTKSYLDEPPAIADPKPGDPVIPGIDEPIIPINPDDLIYKPINPDEVTKPSDPDNVDKPGAPDSTVKPGDPDETVKPGGSDDSTDKNKPSKPSDSSAGTENKIDAITESKLPDSVVSSIVDRVQVSASGETIKVNMNSSTTVSKEILEAARGKDVNVVLEMDGYSWTINGKDVQAMNLQDINLKVTKHTDNIPSSTVKALAGGNPCMQISLAHEGNFGFKASLNIGVGTENTGKYGNLYYHDSAGKMVFMDAGQIDANGNVSLDFSHASDYLLVMSDQAMSQANVPGSLMPAGTDVNPNGDGNINTSTTSTGSNVRRSAKTGDYATVYLWLLLCTAAMGVMAYTSRRKRVQ